jgi:hypothetical protein
LRLGYADIDAMLEELDIDTFREWQTYYGLEPWDVQSSQLATLQAMIANIHRREGDPAVEPLDFMPWLKRN